MTKNSSSSIAARKKFTHTRGTKLLAAFIASTFALAAAAAVTAQNNSLQIVFAITPAQSKLHYTLSATAHEVHGEFDFKRGELRVEPASGQASGEIVVDATSGRSGSDGRDSKMHKDVLESAKYPEIVFRADRVNGFSAGATAIHASIHGVFSVHGANHEMTIPVEATLTGNNWTATSRFSVPYVDWGLRDPSNFLLHVGHSVQIELTIAGTISNPPATH